MMVRHPGLSLLLCTLGLSYAEGQERTPNVASTPAIPVLDFPEPGLDDPAAYQGYQTRFYRDSKQNTVQVYLEPRGGRVVTLWADAADESAGFTVRDGAGGPAPLAWGARAADVAGEETRSVEYRLVAGVSRIEVGGFLLGSMRVERDYQYAKRHLKPLRPVPFQVPEESLLVAAVTRLPPAERERHLAILGAADLASLRSRLAPALTSACADDLCTVRVERPSLDGRNRLLVELRVDARRVKVELHQQTVSLRTRPGSNVAFAVRVSTDAPPLNPLARDEIFNPAFLQFLAGAAVAGDSGGGIRYRRLERQVRGVELLSSKEKLMAGLPNFATYFGRDMMMTALMMRSIWTAGMSEHVIASVLRKLGPKGDVSHEEALGGQAIRENAVVYDSLVTGYLRAVRSGRRPQADSLLDQAGALLGALQQTRENYHMIDDEFQLPVLAAAYLGDSTVTPEQKRAFLFDSSDARGPRLALLLQELDLLTRWTRPYADDPRATRLVSFPRRDATHWRSASWRDSDAGYAGGRFAMDINVIWVPKALRSIDTILGMLSSLGITTPVLDSLIPDSDTVLAGYISDRSSLRSAVETWEGARRHFRVRLSPAEIRRRTAAKLAWLPAPERRYWKKEMAERREVGDSLSFLALSLDSDGRPLPVLNTDPATELFLNPGLNAAEALEDLVPFSRPFPGGLFVEGLGPLVANDGFASRRIWDRFQADQYHGPRVVWGREVNLLFLGLANQISTAEESQRSRLRDALHQTLAAVDASGLQHNELWSYQIRGGKLVPVRYGTSSDVQLWNTTDLAVEFVLSQLGGLEK